MLPDQKCKKLKIFFLGCRRAAGVQLPDGRVSITGGCLNKNTITDTTELLEPTHGSMFKSGPLLPKDVEFHCILMDTESHILYAGKLSMHVLDDIFQPLIFFLAT